MNRIITLAAIAALSATMLNARELTPSEAWNRVIVSGEAPLKVRGSSAAHRLVKTVNAADNQPAYYVFNTGDRTVFISADDVAAPVLGYTEGKIEDMTQIPPALSYMLETYVRQIEWAKAKGIQTSYASTRSGDRAPIEPLVQTKWSQSSPYNDMCPLMSDGKHSYTGCVATAMAQVMYYHKYPEVGEGEISYEWKKKTLSLNLADYPLDWDNMLLTYPEANTGTDIQRHAIASFMKAAGYALHMDYTTNESDGSSAYGYDVPNVLADNFHYDAGIRDEYRDFYKFADWESMIYNELASSRPLVYCGRSSGGGHAFICDGYSKDGLFHINWGWNGKSDGYFLLTALDPSSLGEGGGEGSYNDDQQAIFGIQRPLSGSLPQESYIGCRTGIYALSDKYTLSIRPFFTGLDGKLFTNFGRLEGSFSFAMQLVNEEDGKEYIINSSDEQSYTLAPQGNIKFIKATIPDNIPLGSYKVYPLYSLNQGNWQRIRINASYKPYVLVSIEEGGVKVDKESLQPGINIIGAEMKTELAPGAPYTIRVELYNSSSIKADAEVFAVLTDVNDFQFEEDELESVSTEMEPNSQTNLEIRGILNDYIMAGRYAVKLTCGNSAEWIINDVEVKSEPSSVSSIGIDMNSVPANIIYDLSGRRVDTNSLVPGVYIKVSGATREKILIP